MSKVTCPFCAKSFILHDQQTWREYLPYLFGPFTETASPISTASLIARGRALALWASYSAGHRRLLQLVEEGILISAAQGWWTLSEIGRQLGRAAPTMELDPLTAAKLATPPPEDHSPETIPVPSRELLLFLREFVDFPNLSSINKIARYAVACGFLEKRGVTAKVRSLIANGYLRWVQSRLVLTSAAQRILAREFPSVDRTPGMHD